MNARGFASDNAAGVHPQVLAAIAAANEGHALAYGMDPWTLRAQDLFRRHFGEQAQAFPMFNGTGTNVLVLQAMVRRHEAVICPATAHINVDECGAPERIGGYKLLPVATEDGKLTPELARTRIVRIGDEHSSQPRAITISNSTELGTVYTREETRALADFAHEHGMYLHVDGARLANAAVACGCSLGELTTECGVDAVSFGGTKNGLLGGEAAVFLNPELAEDFRFLRKQGMQLASKMRFISAQFEALLEGSLWHDCAAHANAMAARLAAAASEIPGVSISRPVEANAVFAVLPPGAAQRVQQQFIFYVWDEASGEVRWMCSWDTAESDVDEFAAAVAEAAAAAN